MKMIIQHVSLSHLCDELRDGEEMCVGIVSFVQCVWPHALMIVQLDNQRLFCHGAQHVSFCLGKL